MQTLTPQELANIERALFVWSAERGPNILGAQLGQLIGKAIYPRTVREFGGLKLLAQTALQGLVEQGPPTTITTDLQFRIRRDMGKGSHDVPTGEAEVAGTSLWRFFSNPNLDCQVGLRLPASPIVSLASHAVAEDIRPMRRMAVREYKELANAFLQQLPDELGTKLAQVLGEEDFYPAWISALRAAWHPERRLLREWETLRVERVADRLREELIAAGADTKTAAAIVDTARPSPEPPRLSRPTSFLRAGMRGMPQGPRVQQENGAENGAETLRRLIHAAVELMSEAELRDLRLSAGLLHDAWRRVR